MKVLRYLNIKAEMNNKTKYIKDVRKTFYRAIISRYRCYCGKYFEAFKSNVIRGLQRSCGCLKKEVTRKRSLTHGATINRRRTPEYTSWIKMRERCYDKRNNRYVNYGAKGVQVCQQWKRSFSAFLKDMGKRPPRKTLDRIDPEGNYTPINCRWATYKQQARNRRQK